jgi:hypothetical protein
MITVNGQTFQKQYRKCGKDCTHGPEGKGHGPYWYKSAPGESLKYVGKDLPAEVIRHLEMVKVDKAAIEATAATFAKQEREFYAKAQHAGELRRAAESVLHGGNLSKSLLTEAGLADYFVLV